MKKIFLLGVVISVLMMIPANAYSQRAKVVQQTVQKISKNKNVQQSLTKNVNKYGKTGSKRASKYKNGQWENHNAKDKTNTKKTGKEILKKTGEKAIEYTSIWECPNCGFRICFKTKKPPLYKNCSKCKARMKRLI